MKTLRMKTESATSMMSPSFLPNSAQLLSPTNTSKVSKRSWRRILVMVIVTVILQLLMMVTMMTVITWKVTNPGPDGTNPTAKP